MADRDVAGARETDRQEFLACLTQTERQVLALHYAEGLTAKEIAVVLKMTQTEILEIVQLLRNQAQRAMQKVGAQEFSQPTP